MKKPYIQFKIFPETKGKYYKVIIFRTKELMYKYFDIWHEDVDVKAIKFTYDKGKNNFEAICQSWDVYEYQKCKKWTKKPQLGQILFHYDMVWSGVVAHELTHAAISFARRKKILHKIDEKDSSNASKYEEKICHYLGQMTANFWHKWYKLNCEKRLK